LWLGEEEEEEE